MAYRCEICGKGPAAGKTVSHSKRHTPRVFNPNLAKRTIYKNLIPQRAYVCMTCLKSGRARLYPN